MSDLNATPAATEPDLDTNRSAMVEIEGDAVTLSETDAADATFVAEGAEEDAAANTARAKAEPSADDRDLVDRATLNHWVGVMDRIATTLQEIRRDADRAGEIIERLEAENHRLKRRQDERRLEPAIKGIISLYDDVARIAEASLSSGASDSSQTFRVLQQQSLELLYRLGVCDVEPSRGEMFDPKRQEVIATVATAERAEHLQIASVIRPGFEFAGRMIRPAGVELHRHDDDPST